MSRTRPVSTPHRPDSRSLRDGATYSVYTALPSDDRRHDDGLHAPPQPKGNVMKAMTHKMLPLCLMLSLIVSHASAAADAIHAPRSPMLQLSKASVGSPQKIATKASLATAMLPLGVTLRDIDGGPQYFANKDPRSAWMDSHIWLGAWLEQPVDATQVGYAVAMGENIYWNIAGVAGDPTQPRADYDVIRAAGMHISAPDTTPNSGSETVSYDGWD